MKGYSKMSNREANRISVMDKLVKKEIKQKEAAVLLSLSVRQTRRLEKRYQREGASGLIHKRRGKVGNRLIPPEKINQALEIIEKQYWDFGPTLAWEKLTENHGFSFSRETLRKAMIKHDIWKPKKRKKPRIHQMRERRPCRGELIQMDGSPHLWFEDRRPECTLLGYIDDADSKVKQLYFAETETTLAYFQSSKGYFQSHGKPLALYGDKNSIFRVNTNKGESSSVNDSQGLTQFGRAMKQLDIEVICAHTPQAKGRIENLFGTLQDRLVKELRLRNISTIKEANQYLPEFIIKFNQKFSVKPRNSTNTHRPLLPADDLERILAFHYQRILSKNLTCQFENKVYQIKTKRPTYTMRHAPVLVIKDLEGNIAIEYKGKNLDYTILRKQPKSRIIDTKQLNKTIDRIKADKNKNSKRGETEKTPWKPSPHHPWRYFTI